MRNKIRRAAVITGAASALILIPSGFAVAGNGYGPGPGDGSGTCTTCDHVPDRDGTGPAWKTNADQPAGAQAQNRNATNGGQQARDGTGPYHDQNSATPGQGNGARDGTGPRADCPLK